MTLFALHPMLEGTVRFTQGFGWRPDYYNQFGLPGHEGIDMVGSGLYVLAGVAGVVTEVGWHNGNIHHAYGYNVRIQTVTDDGVYTVIYAHGKPGTEQTKVGDQVVIGQRLIQWDSTGNVQGAHLHVTVELSGATQKGITTYPYNIIDPTPYLVPAVSSPVFAFPCQARVIAHDGLRVRSGAGTDNPKIRTLPYDEVVDVIGAQTDKTGIAWGQIAGGGWIALMYTAETSVS